MSDEPRIVEAVASMTPVAELGDAAGQSLVSRIQDAMVAAVQKCQADGITDPEIIRQAQIDARDRVLSEG